ncbi:hypothetical protein ABEV54_05765 [Peribacillus psychrosaccharolyticus]|uniref:hypothetical protein n=1 Tax=Peribacillus psychrosaccharolyticus TaxID=1407 RepID=UPI003D29CC95
MKKIKYKNIEYQNLLIKCVEGIHDTNLQSNVYNNISSFKERSTNYKKLAERQTLYQISSELKNDFIYENMTFLYGKLRDSSHSRTYYDKIMGFSKICPYCGVQISSSLDHYLPKRHYPMFSVDPMNLLPCCSDCNTTKGEHKQLQESETLHPYFDKYSNVRFLEMDVIEIDDNVAFQYYLNIPSDLSMQEYRKVAKHFELLELNRMYSILASTEVHSQIYNLKKLYKEGGKEALQQNLDDIYYSNLHAEINSWKTALYDGLRKSEWFCEKGIFIFEYVSDESEGIEELIPIPNKDKSI